MHSGLRTRTTLPLDDRALIQAQVERVSLRAGSIVMHPTSNPASPIEIAWSRPPPRGRREILASRGSEGHDRGIKAEARTVLLRSIALGRRWLDEVLGGVTIDEIADRERCTKRHVADTLPLAFLAPGLVRAVIEARLPRGISTRSIAEPELEWSRQWTTLGISARPATLA
jgi:site-specific DNA recombinase